MIRRIRSLLLACICLLLSYSSKEQAPQPEYSIVNYNSDNALSQNSINDMVFDRNGFLWMATGMGVVRFDGRNFREYNRQNSPTLTSDRCAVIFRDQRSGTIVIQPRFGVHEFLKVTDDYQLTKDTIRSANPYRGHIFSYPGLYRKWAAADTGAFGGLFNNLEINADLLPVNETQAYVRKNLHYYFLDENTTTVHLLSGITGHEPKIQFMIGGVYVFVDRQNRLYAYKDGLYQNISGSDSLMKLLAPLSVTGPYPMQAETKVFRDTTHSFLIRKGDILLLHITNGVVSYEALAANTPIRNISCMQYDQRNKIIYAGTATSGFYVLKKRKFQRLYFSSDNFVINSLYAQVELSGGKILTSSGILDRHEKLIHPMPGMYDRPAFLRSSDGYIWYSAYGWLKRTDTSLHHSENIVPLGDISVFGIWVSSIVETADKDILCSTQTGKLFRVSGKTATLLLDMKNILKGGEILTILPVDEKNCWIGTTAGLYSYQLQQSTLCRLPGMENTAVRVIHKDKSNGLWLGTYGQGYYKYEKGRFIKMPMDAANNLTNVHCFMEDDKGYFWLPTNRGLFRVLKHELDEFASGAGKSVFYYYFDKYSGFATNEFDGGCTPCGIVTRDGRFSLPSLDGLIQFNPDSITIIPPDGHIFIDRLLADNKQTLSCEYFEQRQDAGPLAFSVSSPYFGNPANLHLEYFIRELDSNWHPVNSDGKLALTGLGRGKYTLTIRKQEGDARYRYKTVSWTILPYWYQTTWFQVLAALVIISILPAIFWIRYIRQVARAKHLEQKVTERTEALSESNRVKEKMIAIILHDLRSPLRFLHMLATHVYDNYTSFPAMQLKEILQKFQNATSDLYEFTQDFVIWTNAQKEGFVVRAEKITLREIVGEIVSLYETGADIRNNTVLNLVPAEAFLVSDPHILKVIIRNLTDNANKNTHNGEIKIEAKQQDSGVCITITDSGRSMDKQLIDGILNNAYQTDSDHHGFGYKIILELLGRIKGRLQIDTPGDIGNRVTLLFGKCVKNNLPLTRKSI